MDNKLDYYFFNDYTKDKDYSVKGGDFKYKIKGKEYTHCVKKGDIILFGGDLIHKPTETYGFGCRDSIIVFIKRV